MVGKLSECDSADQLLTTIDLLYGSCKQHLHNFLDEIFTEWQIWPRPINAEGAVGAVLRKSETQPKIKGMNGVASETIVQHQIYRLISRLPFLFETLQYVALGLDFNPYSGRISDALTEGESKRQWKRQSWDARFPNSRGVFKDWNFSRNQFFEALSKHQNIQRRVERVVSEIQFERLRTIHKVATEIENAKPRPLKIMLTGNGPFGTWEVTEERHDLGITEFILTHPYENPSLDKEKFYPVDQYDTVGLIKTYENEKPDVVLFEENNIAPHFCGYLRSRNAIAYPDPHTMEILLDRESTRRLMAIIVPAPEHRVIDVTEPDNKAREKIQELHKPVLLKPEIGRSGFGISKIEREEDVSRALSYTRNRCKERQISKIIAEECVLPEEPLFRGKDPIIRELQYPVAKLGSYVWCDKPIGIVKKLIFEANGIVCGLSATQLVVQPCDPYVSRDIIDRGKELCVQMAKNPELGKGLYSPSLYLRPDGDLGLTMFDPGPSDGSIATKFTRGISDFLLQIYFAYDLVTRHMLENMESTEDGYVAVSSSYTPFIPQELATKFGRHYEIIGKEKIQEMGGTGYWYKKPLRSHPRHIGSVSVQDSDESALTAVKAASLVQIATNPDCSEMFGLHECLSS